MKRRITRLTQIGLDLAILSAALSFALLLRFDWRPPLDMVGRLLLTLPYVVLFQYLVLMAFGVHRFSWRYIGLREAVRIVTSLGVAMIGLVAVRLVLGQLQGAYPVLRHGVLPLGVVAANYVLAATGIAGVRAARRLLGERAEQARSTPPKRVEPAPTLLVGAGQAGVMVTRELERNPALGIEPVAFLDDDTAKTGTTVHGVPVLGTTRDLARLAAESGARQVLVTIAGLPGDAMRELRRRCDEAGLPMKVVPGLYEIVDGSANLSRIREVALEDLLRRAPVSLDQEELASFLEDQVVLVTGAGGSIGSELARQALRFRPRKLILLERAENALFEIHRELVNCEAQLVPVIADVCDEGRLDSIFARHRPGVVIHAAAHKHVPMMEANPWEAAKNNIGGSKRVADAAHRYGCAAFVMVSTDKAVNPTSVMGATKRLAELYVQSLAKESATRFVTVRFGNVLGSNGSVVPIFREQIARGGPVTVTHPEMRRYFMTIPEACQLVLQAGAMGDGGEIFILDMGDPVKIVDLARDLIGLSGLREPQDIEIVFTGARPGEKLYEELASELEHASTTRHPKIFVGRSHLPEWAESRVHAGATLLQFLDRDEPAAPDVIHGLEALLPEYRRTPGEVAAPTQPAPLGLPHPSAT